MNTVLRSFWIVVYASNCMGATAILESSMLNALHRFMIIPLSFFNLKEHSDIYWECESKLEVMSHKKVIKVFMQDDPPPEIEAWGGPKIIVDLRHPDLWESAKRQAGGFKRIPSIINFGD